MYNINNMNGYTFLESILSMMLFTMIVGSIIMVFPWYEKSANSIMNSYAAEYEVFLSELRSDLINSSKVSERYKSTLDIVSDYSNEGGGNIKIEYFMSSGRILKRYSDLGGSDIKLTRIKKVEYKIENEKIIMTTNFNNRTEKVREIVYPQ